MDHVYPLSYYIKSDFLFVVCPSRTIFGNRKGAHVHLEGLKHGNGNVGLNMIWCVRSSGCYGCYGAHVHVQLPIKVWFCFPLDVGITVRAALNV